MILFYIRHGDPIYDPDSLTPLGHRQAESVAKRLSLFGLDEIYSSSSIRAQQTAQPTCELTHKQPILLDWMHEKLAHAEMAEPLPNGVKTWIWNHPDYEQVLFSREVRELGDRWYTHPAFVAGHYERAEERIRTHQDAWLASLGLAHDRERGLFKVTEPIAGRRIALFAHEGAGKLFMSQLLDIPLPLYASHFDMKHTGITAILFDEGRNQPLGGYARARVMTLSNDSHLYRDGLPLMHVSTALRERY